MSRRRNRTIFSRYSPPDRRVTAGFLKDDDGEDQGGGGGLGSLVNALPSLAEAAPLIAAAHFHLASDDERDSDEESWQSANDDTKDDDGDSDDGGNPFAKSDDDSDDDSDDAQKTSRLHRLAARESMLLQAMAHANLGEQQRIMGELNDIKMERNAIHQAARSIDLANTVIASHLTPVISTMSRSSSASDWLAEIETPHHASASVNIRAEADLWWKRLHADVKADTREMVTQALGYSRIVTSGYVDPDGAQQLFMDRVVSLASAEPAGEPAEDGAAESSLPVAVNPSDAPETFDTDTLSSTARRSPAPIVRDRINRLAGATTIMGPNDSYKNAPKNEQDAYRAFVSQGAADSDSAYYVPLNFDSWRRGYWDDEKNNTTYAPGLPPMASSKTASGENTDTSIQLATHNKQHNNGNRPSDCPYCYPKSSARKTSSLDALKQAVLDYSFGRRGLKVGDQIGEYTITDVGTQTVQYTDGTWSGSLQLQFVDNSTAGNGASTWAGDQAINAYSRKKTASPDNWEGMEIQKDDEGYFWDPDSKDRFETKEDARYNKDYWVGEHKRTGGKKTASNVDLIRQIVQDKQAQTIGGVLVDGQSANLMIQILDQLSPENQATFAQLIESDPGKAGEIAWKLTKSSRRKTAAEDGTIYSLSIGGVDFIWEYDSDSDMISIGYSGGSPDMDSAPASEYGATPEEAAQVICRLWITDGMHLSRKSSSRRMAAEGGMTCSSCGDAIAKDPDGTYHHDNGETHDHEAQSGSKESRRRTASWAYNDGYTDGMQGLDMDIVSADDPEYQRGYAAGKAAVENGSWVASRRRTAVSLTNVSLDGENGIGTDPQGNRVRFRLSPQDRKDLSSVLFGDLAGNFSGVDIEESDIIREGARRTAADEPSESGAAESTLPVAINPTDAPESLDPLSTDQATGPGAIDGGSFTPSGAAASPDSSAFTQYVQSASKLSAFRQRVQANTRPTGR